MIETEVDLPVNLPDSPVPETLTIVITQEDVENGIKVSVTSCVVALATKRALKEWNPEFVGAFYESIHGNIDGEEFCWTTPKNLFESMERWDNDGEFTELGEFHLSRE
jgi:hypothetical protein